MESITARDPIFDNLINPDNPFESGNPRSFYSPNDEAPAPQPSPTPPPKRIVRLGSQRTPESLQMRQILNEAESDMPRLLPLNDWLEDINAELARIQATLLFPQKRMHIFNVVRIIGLVSLIAFAALQLSWVLITSSAIVCIGFHRAYSKYRAIVNPIQHNINQIQSCKDDLSNDTFQSFAEEALKCYRYFLAISRKSGMSTVNHANVIALLKQDLQKQFNTHDFTIISLSLQNIANNKSVTVPSFLHCNLQELIGIHNCFISATSAPAASQETPSKTPLRRHTTHRQEALIQVLVREIETRTKQQNNV